MKSAALVITWFVVISSAAIVGATGIAKKNPATHFNPTNPAKLAPERALAFSAPPFSPRQL